MRGAHPAAAEPSPAARPADGTLGSEKRDSEVFDTVRFMKSRVLENDTDVFGSG